MSDHLDQFLYDAPTAEIRAELERLTARVADLELHDEGNTRLIAAYRRVAVMSRWGFVLRRDVERDDRLVDLWVRRHDPGDGVDEVPAGSFDRDVIDEIARAVEGMPSDAL